MSNSPSDNRPDLDDSINVAEAHAAIGSEEAAASREKRLRENGMEPVSLWMILVSGLVILVGGAVLGAGGGLFNYDELTKTGYVRERQPEYGDVELLPVAYQDWLIANGKGKFNVCAGCHGASGDGNGGNVPPLAGSEWVTGDNTEALAMIILNGLSGPIEVKGKSYGAEAMPAMSSGLEDPKALASMMTFIRAELGGNQASIVTPEMAEKALEAHKNRGPGSAVTVDELKKNHWKKLEGAEVDPEMMVNPETGEPVPAE